MYAFEFTKWLNNEYLPNNPDKAFIKEVSSKSVSNAVRNIERGYIRFFRGISNKPTFRKKGKNDPTMYFVRNSLKRPIRCERHRIYIYSLGWVRIKEYGYIPQHNIINGYISIRAGKVFVSVTAEVPAKENISAKTEGIGIDLGVKEFATTSNGISYPNINKSPEVKRLEKKLKREQRKLCRKYTSLKKRRLSDPNASSNNYAKQLLKLQSVHLKLINIRDDYTNKVIADIIKSNPEYITIEDLNCKGLMRNRHLSNAIHEQRFATFRKRLQSKCAEKNIELRIANTFFPSSKTCNNCGRIKKDLSLKDRTFICECGYKEDRDINAAKNLRDYVPMVGRKLTPVDCDTNVSSLGKNAQKEAGTLL